MTESDKSKLQDQRDLWLRAKANLATVTREEEEGIDRLKANTKRAVERANQEQQALSDLILKTKMAADDFMRDPDEVEKARAGAAVAAVQGAGCGAGKPADVPDAGPPLTPQRPVVIAASPVVRDTDEARASIFQNPDSAKGAKPAAV